MEEKLNAFLRTTFVKRLLLYAVLIFAFWELKGFWNLFLMIFFVTYLMNELSKFFHSHLSKVVKISEVSVIIITYSVLTILLTCALMRYTPIALDQAKSIASSFDPKNNMNLDISQRINDFFISENPYLKRVFTYYNIDVAQKLNQFSGAITSFSYHLIKSVGIWMFNIFLMIILSLFFLVEKTKMKKFVDLFKESKISFVYNELKQPLIRFYKIFGMMIKTQIIISIINTTITVLALFLLGFPNLFALGIMILLLGLIPVAGVIISTIPLLLIGFKIGGLAYITYILVLIVIIHALEAYVLFPKISSNFTRLPVFITLLVLLVSEYLLGPWGLIFGLPIFVFIVESLKNKSSVDVVESPPLKEK